MGVDDGVGAVAPRFEVSPAGACVTRLIDILEGPSCGASHWRSRAKWSEESAAPPIPTTAIVTNISLKASPNVQTARCRRLPALAVRRLAGSLLNSRYCGSMDAASAAASTASACFTRNAPLWSSFQKMNERRARRTPSTTPKPDVEAFCIVPASPAATMPEKTEKKLNTVMRCAAWASK